MTGTRTTTAGTAGPGFRAAPVPHPYEAAPADWGARPSCTCGQPLDAAVHQIPDPRKASE